ncbi:hypothetical protein IAR55_003470 [Kwoniella newhampshirensis]|uniref:BZIP domain-containing protein n=1 Tax=Kwoniella newhampshirensis TaxID=1651941 RepID=A0AAW0YZ78_9TREE
MASLRAGSEDGFDDEDFGAGGGKKRKVPGVQFQSRRTTMDDYDDDVHDKPTPSSSSFPLARRSPRSLARTLCEFRKGLFLRRKAAFISLYIDAQTAITSNTSSGRPKATLPDVSSFEKLLPSLEDVGVNAWMPDRPGWREGRAETWRVRKCRRQRGTTRKPVERKGLAPEGSFEFEMECKASAMLRARAREQAALLRLANELRGVVLSANKLEPVVQTAAAAASPDDEPPSKSKRKIEKKLETTITRQALAMAEEASGEGSEEKSKKRSKKKKKGVRANQSNPHHVNNSPLPGTPAPSTAVRPAEDDYICCFCEYDLFYGSEKARKRAIRQRRRELKRKEAIRLKAKNVAEGRGILKEESDEGEDDDDDYDDVDCKYDANGPEQTDAG